MNHLSMAVAVGGVVSLVVERRRPELRWWAAGGSAGLVIAPGLALILAAVGLVARSVRSWLVHQRINRQSDADVALLARSVLISVTAGMPLPAALDLAADQVQPALAAEIRATLRRARRVGLARSLAESDGRGARLYILMARAQTTGASISGAVAAFVDEQRRQQQAESLEAARRLPVKLTIPLALLILPGFVVLTVGPSVLSTASRLLGPLVPLP